MNAREFQLLGVVDPRLAPHATSALPAWLWSTDGLALLWANPVGAGVFGAANSAVLAKRTFGPADAHRRQVVKLAGRLSSIGAIRLERLRGFGASLGSRMTCACKRLDFDDGSHGILIVATEPLRPAIPLIERLRRLVEGFETPIAAFSRDGFFVAASEAGRPLLGFRDLSEAGLDNALSDALANHRVERTIATGQMVLQRVGSGNDTGLVAMMTSRELRRLEPLSEPPISLAADTLPTNLQHPAAAHPPATDAVIPLPGPRASMADETSPPTDLDEAVEPPKNVVPFRAPGEPKLPALTPVEDNAFNELGRQLSLQLERDEGGAPDAPATRDATEQSEPPREPLAAQAASGQAEWLQPAEAPARGEVRRDRALLDLLPTGILIYRLDRLLYANPAFLARLGYDSLHALEHAGGLDALYVEAGVSQASSTSQAGTPVTISAGHESSRPSTPAEARLFTISWDGESALALIFTATGHAAHDEAAPARVPPAPATLPPLAGTNADLLARISHEVRAPLNTIIGFSEVMIGERFGALGNERYTEYLKDIRTSGERVAAVINDLTELSRIETGKLDLAFASQNLNELVESCVTVMQPQANRERIIIRTSLAQSLPPVVADGRTLRQITLNLIGNSIHLANPAGQVIVSTALSDLGEVVLRVRDTGQGLNDNEVAAALEPFRALPPSDNGSPVNLSLTKALVEANRARFHIRTGGRSSGTLIEVIFPRAMAGA